MHEIKPGNSLQPDTAPTQVVHTTTHTTTPNTGTDIDPFIGIKLPNDTKSDSSPISFTYKLKSALTSPAVIAGLGSSVVVLPTSITSTAVMFAFTALSSWNEFHKHNSSQEISVERQNKDFPNGLRGLILQKVSDPGFCVMMHSLTYAATSIKSFAAGEVFNTIAFTTFAIGAAAATHLVNQSRSPTNRVLTSVENKLNTLWNKLSENVRNVLKDPGAMFPTGNLILLATTTWDNYQANGIANYSHPGIILGMTVGAVLAITAAARGLKPLFTTNQSQISGTAVTLGGFGDIALGLTSVVAGAGSYSATCVGIATVLWGISNIAYGLRMQADILQKMFSIFKRKTD